MTARSPPRPGHDDPFPWDVMIGFGIGVLGLAPRDFWASTPSELAAVARGLAILTVPTRSAVSPLSRANLEQLIHHFPDQPHQPAIPSPEIVKART